MQIITQRPYLYLHTSAGVVQSVWRVINHTGKQWHDKHSPYIITVITLYVTNHIHHTHTHLGALKQNESFKRVQVPRREVEVCYTCQHFVFTEFLLSLNSSCP